MQSLGINTKVFNTKSRNANKDSSLKSHAESMVGFIESDRPILGVKRSWETSAEGNYINEEFTYYIIVKPIGD